MSSDPQLGSDSVTSEEATETNRLDSSIDELLDVESADSSPDEGVYGHALAYVFERFPSFTQTFCAREVVELEAQGLAPLIFSIRDTSDEPPGQYDPSLRERTITLPSPEKLREQVQRWKEQGHLPQDAVLLLRYWGQRGDKNRLYEAIWIGMELRRRGIAHAHTHFAGIGARCCWWMRQIFGNSYSLTGHANDLFCAEDEVLGLHRVLADAALVVTVSEFTADWIRENYPDSAPVKRVYNGLNLAPFEAQSAQAGRVVEPVQICTVGRLIEKKGFDDLIRACGTLTRAGVALRCVIAGDGPLEDELCALMAAEGLEDVVELAGSMDQEQIRALLQNSQIFALPCVVEKGGGMDNLPTVIAEAMAARLPVVSTRLAGVPEMVSEEKTGLLADPRCPDDLAVLLRRLIENPQLREKFGKRAQEVARDLFDREGPVSCLRHLLVEHGRIAPRLSQPVWAMDLWLPFAKQQLRRLGLYGGFGGRWRWRTPKGQDDGEFITAALDSLKD